MVYGSAVGFLLRAQCKKAHHSHHLRFRVGGDVRIIRVATIGVLLITAGSARLKGGQMPGTENGQQVDKSQIKQVDPNDAKLRDQQDRLLREARQKRMIADTDKLAVLVTDLKAQVNSSTINSLPVDTIKKADEIEKLARDLKKKLKG